jgi:hypothetical protein
MIDQAKNILLRLNDAWSNKLAEQLVELEQALLNQASGTIEFECERFWNTVNTLRDLTIANMFLFRDHQPAAAPTVALPVEPDRSQVLFNALTAVINAIQSEHTNLAVYLVGELLGVNQQRAELCVGYLRDQIGFCPTVFAKIVCLRQAVVNGDLTCVPLLQEVFGLERREAIVTANNLHQTYGVTK